MNKNQFLKILDNKLKKVPKQERLEAIEFYRNYIEDAESEEEAISSLEHPSVIAAKLILEIGEKDSSNISMLTIILAVTSIPILVPIGLVMLAVLVTVAALVFSLVIAFGSIIGALILTVIASISSIVPALNTNVETVLLIIGTILVAISMIYFMIRALVLIISKIIAKGKSAIIKISKRRQKNEK